MFPKSVYFILSMEFCERFTFHGLRSILVLYFTNFLLLSTNSATALFHFFVFFAYFTPLLGAFIADNLIGKYWTIASLSAVYTMGTVTITGTAIFFPSLPLMLFGLLLVAFGAGGIKPCVSTMGADQFDSNDKKTLDSFFSLFYFIINVGSMSMFVTPVLRSTVQCFNDDCYALAFGVPAVLMFMALTIFILGSRMYVRKPVEENVLCKSFLCFINATKNYMNHRKTKPMDRFLDYSLDKYDPAFIQDVRVLGRILVLYLPLPMFFALYEQMSSTWILQAAHMDGYLFADWVMLPDQAPTINTIIVLIFIPIFDCFIYPLIDLLPCKFTHLRRMIVGFLTISASFFACWVLQVHIETLAPIPVPNDMAQVRLLSMEACPVMAYTQNPPLLQWSSSGTPLYNSFDEIQFIPLRSNESFQSNLDVMIQMQTCKALPQLPSNISLSTTLNGSAIEGGKSYILVVWLDPYSNELMSMLLPSQNEKLKVGKSQLRVVAKKDPVLEQAKITLFTRSPTARDEDFPLLKFSNDSHQLFVSNYMDSVNRAFYDITITEQYNSLRQSKVTYSLGTFDIKNNEIATFVLYKVLTFLDPHVPTYVWKAAYLVERPGDTLAIWYQMPQFILITASEVFFTISAYSFSYNEAPTTMKSTVNAMFLLSIGVGNLIVFFVSQANIFAKQSHDFFFFTAMCLVTTIVFGIMTARYESKKAADQQIVPPMEKPNFDSEKVPPPKNEE